MNMLTLNKIQLCVIYAKIHQNLVQRMGRGETTARTRDTAENI